MYQRDQQKHLVRNIICGIFCLVLVILLVLLFWRNSRQEEAYTSAITELQEEAAAYESQLRALQVELSKLQGEIAYTSEEAKIMVGFLISDVEDIAYMEERAQDYQFSPVLVIDCTMEMEDIAEFISAADEDWEIMLYATAFSEETNDAVLSVLDYLESIEREHTGIFFLRGDYYNTANIQRILDDGFLGYTNYHDDPDDGQTEEGAVYFDYSFLTIETSIMTSRLYSLYCDKASMIVVFDMASINAGTLSESFVTGLLDRMQYYAESEDCTFSTVAEVVQELSQVNATEAENQAAYDTQAAAIQAQIAELQEVIDEIYDRLEY